MDRDELKVLIREVLKEEMRNSFFIYADANAEYNYFSDRDEFSFSVKLVYDDIEITS